MPYDGGSHRLSIAALKRMCRYLAGQPRLVFKYDYQRASEISVYTDTDWAGCPKTRRSTSGGAILIGSHLIKTWSSTQPTVSLSSGEAEFYGLVKASGMGLGFQALMRDAGVELPVTAYTDSSAAMGISARQGLGKLRHLDTHSLWLQQAVRSGRIAIRKVRGEYNPADLFTKHIGSKEKVHQLVRLFGCYYATGRADAAPTLRTTRMTRDTLGDLLDRGAKSNDELEDILEGECNVAEFQQHLEAPEPEHEGLPHQVPANQRDHYYPLAPRLSGHDDYNQHEQLNDFDHETHDLIEQAGLAIAQEIKEEMLVSGRRRRPL